MLKKRRNRNSWFRNQLKLPNIKTPQVRADFLLLFVTFLLSVFGLIMVYDASVVEANEVIGDRFHFLKYQGIYLIIGWIGLLVAGHIPYTWYKRVIVWVFGLNLFLMALVLIPGIGLSLNGARRWLNLGIGTLQPSEPFKTVLILYLAKWLEQKRTLMQFLALIGLILGLFLLQPDLGTAVVSVVAAFIVYFVSGAPFFKFVISGLFGLALGLMLILTSPYRRQRLMTFLDPANDPMGTSYHIQQILLSLGSGGLFGLGLGQSKQKYQYLPEANTDSIFAVVGEETGFVGTSLIVILFMVVIWKGFKIAQQAPDLYGRLLAAGITSWIALQTCVNLASMVALIPLKGIPLPFISYGGTSLVVTLVSVGILLNISKHRRV